MVIEDQDSRPHDRFTQGSTEKKLTALTVNGITYKLIHPDDSSTRYTKDLEDMLGRIVQDIDMAWQVACCAAHAIGSDHMPNCLIAEAKTLLERTGYTEDF